MAENSSGGVGLLGVIIGAVLVIAVGAFFLGIIPGGPNKSVVDVNIKAPISTPK